MESLIEQYLRSVYNYVYRIVRNEAETEDIIQEVFIKVWKNLNKFNPEQNFKTWLFTIARNTTFDWLRKRKNIAFSKLDSGMDEENKKSFEETIIDMEDLPDEIFMKKELGKELENALLKIRVDFREIILLRYIEELTFAEIAEITSKPLNTIKSHHLRALNALRKILI